jgi:hypothetical protein
LGWLSTKLREPKVLLPAADIALAPALARFLKQHIR